ncbi:hypothetical protein [Amorphus sp. MBR-141]
MFYFRRPTPQSVKDGRAELARWSRFKLAQDPRAIHDFIQEPTPAQMDICIDAAKRALGFLRLSNETRMRILELYRSALWEYLDGGPVPPRLNEIVERDSETSQIAQSAMALAW